MRHVKWLYKPPTHEIKQLQYSLHLSLFSSGYYEGMFDYLMPKQVVPQALKQI